MPRTPFNKAPDPRHRYYAIATPTRKPEDQIELALHCVLTNREDLMSAESREALDGVHAALSSYAQPTVRALFDACLLGRATDEDLNAAFGVSLEEARAYRTLFFDRAVFQNDFHIIAYIRSVKDEAAREMLKEAHMKGFRVLRDRYAMQDVPLDPETALQQVLEGDLQFYLRSRETPLTHRAAKEVRALGKHVVATAQAVNRVKPVAPPKTAGDANIDFVIEKAEPNPTLEELLARGAELAH
jgi:hypothetical protein